MGKENEEEVDSNSQDTGSENIDYKKQSVESGKEAHRLFELNKVIRNPKYLQDLNEKNPSLAEKISKDEYGLSYDEAISEIDGYESNTSKSDEPFDKKALKEELMAEINKDKVVDIEFNFFKEKGIEKETDFYSDFMEIYKDLVSSKNLSTEKATKYLGIAFREAKQSSKNVADYEKVLEEANIASVGNASNKEVVKKKKSGEFRLFKNKSGTADWVK